MKIGSGVETGQSSKHPFPYERCPAQPTNRFIGYNECCSKILSNSKPNFNNLSEAPYSNLLITVSEQSLSRHTGLGCRCGGLSLSRLQTNITYKRHDNTLSVQRHDVQRSAAEITSRQRVIALLSTCQVTVLRSNNYRVYLPTHSFLPTTSSRLYAFLCPHIRPLIP